MHSINLAQKKKIFLLVVKKKSNYKFA